MPTDHLHKSVYCEIRLELLEVSHARYSDVLSFNVKITECSKEGIISVFYCSLAFWLAWRVAVNVSRDGL